MNLSNKKTSQKISIWTLVFTLALTLTAMVFILPAHGKSFLNDAGEAISDVGSGIGDAVSDVGDAVSDIGSGVGDAVSDLTDDTDGDVKDSDGIIGNEQETTPAEDDGMPGWIGIVITLVIVAAVIVLIVVLIPKKRDR
ncbi:MAG: hypothetical protein IJY47_02260 [Clostridia bacterium]|nr:hypothetical protein [Clostridia bacterium]